MSGEDILQVLSLLHLYDINFYDNAIQGIGSGRFILPPGVTLPKHLIPSTPSTSLTHLDDFLYYQSRRRHTVLGDGNCLFRVFSHQLYATEDFHAQLRQSLHHYIEQNKSKYEAYWIDSTISYSHHLQQLQRLGSWGTQLELQAFCDYLCLPLFVCSPNSQTRAYSWGRFAPSTHNSSPDVKLSLSGLPFTAGHLEIAHSSTGDHYDSVVPYSEHSSPLQAPAITQRLVASIDLIS